MMNDCADHPRRYIVAVNPDYGPMGDRSAPRWAEVLERAGHKVRWVNVYRADILDQLAGCDGFMWRHAHHGGMWHIARRLLPVIERELGMAVYPDQNTCWHYDDKNAQCLLLSAAGIPTPKTWVWFERLSAHEWARQASYPVVLKLWSGACASNVRLVRSREEAESWIDLMFTDGVQGLAEELWRPMPWRKRLKAIGRLVANGRPLPPSGEGWELHKNYVYFQEFIPGNLYDTRITIIGNRAFGKRRWNRTDDFRASGSGLMNCDPTQIDLESVHLAFRTAKRLRAQSIALDILRRGEERLVSEISYTYPSPGIRRCPGHWILSEDGDAGTLVWRNGPMWPEEAQVVDFLECLRARDNGNGENTKDVIPQTKAPGRCGAPHPSGPQRTGEEDLGLSQCTGPFALVTPGWPPEALSNGIVSYTARISRILRGLGVRVFVVGSVVGTCEGTSALDVVDVDEDVEKRKVLRRAIQKLGCRLGIDRFGRREYTRRLAARLNEVYRDHGLQLAQMEESFGWAASVADALPVPLVVRAAGPWFLVGPSQGVPADRAFSRRVHAEGVGLRRAAGVISPSRYVLKAISDYYGFVPEIAAAIASPVVTCPPDRRWRPNDSVKGRILFVGRFDRCKGGDLVIQAFARIAREHPEARLVFVGPDRGLIPGTGGAVVHLPEFLDRTIDGGDRGRIEVLGKQTPEQINRLRLECQVCVVCSRFENFPNTVLEAMSQGCPIVASEVGGIPEMIQPERNGLLCRPGDSEDLASKILTLLESPELAGRVGHQAAIDAEERYHPRITAEKTLAFYQQVIERFKVSRPARRRRWPNR